MTDHNTPAIDTSREEVMRLADNLPETQRGVLRLWRAADTLRALLARAEAAEAGIERLSTELVDMKAVSGRWMDRAEAAEAMIEAQAKDHASNNIRLAETAHRAQAAEAEVARLRDVYWRLRSYATHDDGCKLNKAPRFSGPCSCGLADALKGGCSMKAPQTLVGENAIITALRAEIARLTAERDAAMAGRVRVKPLVWTDFGNISVAPDGGGNDDNLAVALCSYFDGWFDCPDEGEDAELDDYDCWKMWVSENAKNVLRRIATRANAVIESRILAALEPQPITVQDAARVPEIAALIEAITNLMSVFPDPCRYDHHGKCQEHFIEDDCSVAKTKAALRAIAEQEGK